MAEVRPRYYGRAPCADCRRCELVGCLPNGLQIITLFPTPVDFLADAVALSSYDVRPSQTTTRIPLARLAIRTETL